MSHTNAVNPCPSCEDKLTQAHEEMAQWFRNQVKPNYPDAHISWTYRDKVSQNQAHAEGKSKLVYPLSAHNKCDDQGNPCALAIDLFQLASNGLACWPWKYFNQIALDMKASCPDMIWGGDFKSLGDADHFQLELPTK